MKLVAEYCQAISRSEQNDIHELYISGKVSFTDYAISNHETAPCRRLKCIKTLIFSCQMLEIEIPRKKMRETTIKADFRR